MRTWFATEIFLAGALLLCAPVRASEVDFYAGLDAYKRGEFAEALEVWVQLAEAGDPESQFRVARLYVEGKGVDRDDEAAVKWYRRAATQGHAQAQGSLGFMLHTGRGVERDLTEAIEWYTKAAGAGRAPAQFNLGVIHLEGTGVAADPGEAARWFKLAAGQGYGPGLTALAGLLEEGRGVESDPLRAFKLRKKAAKGGDPEAEFQLGRMFADGVGTERDMKKAVRYYERSSNRGHEGARAALELLYETPAAPSLDSRRRPEVASTAPVKDEETAAAAQTPSDAPPSTRRAETGEPATKPLEVPAGTATAAGQAAMGAGMTPQQLYERGRASLLGDRVPRDLHRAEQWLRLAAEAGHGEAAYRLALLLYRGESAGGKRYARAYVWFVRAAERGVGDAADWRDRIYEKLNDRERAEARRLLEP